VGAGGDHAGDLDEMQVHGLGVGEGQHEAGADPALRAGGAEDVGPLVPGVADCARPRAASGPDPGGSALLADAGLVLEPDLERLASRRFRQGGGYRLGKVFLNASWAASSALGCWGRGFSRV
jgi:hypothetical protein